MSQSPLDTAIDQLYQLPLDEFVPARQELAKRSSRDEAKRVRALPKPNLVAWALNQLYWSGRHPYDRLVAAAARRRDEQAAALLRRRHDFPAADLAHRQAIGDALREASEMLEQAGHQAGPDTLRSLTAALEAAPWQQDAGRLSRPPDSPGFGILAGLPEAVPPQEREPARVEPPTRPAAKPAPAETPAASRPAPEPGSRPSPVPAPTPVRHPREDVARRQREEEARKGVAVARADAQRATAEVRTAREHLAAAEGAEREARARVQQAGREVQRARDVVRAAERADTKARGALEKAEAAARVRR
jgi:outer membrane biosynthesis protein TonB